MDRETLRSDSARCVVDPMRTDQEPGTEPFVMIGVSELTSSITHALRFEVSVARNVAKAILCACGDAEQAARSDLGNTAAPDERQTKKVVEHG